MHLDPALNPIKKYIEGTLGQEDWAHERFDESALQDILDTQERVCDYIKKKNPKGGEMHNICIVIDDFADDLAALAAIVRRRRIRGGLSHPKSVKETRLENPPPSRLRMICF